VLDASPKTLGAHAERNTAKLGEEGRKRVSEKSKPGKRLMPLAPGGTWDDTPKESRKKPWWRKSDKPINLNKIKDTKKYIETGEM
jgi:hypothetical protein